MSRLVLSRLSLSRLLLSCLVLNWLGCLFLTRLLLTCWLCLSFLVRTLLAFLTVCWRIGLIYFCRIGRRSVSYFFLWLIRLSRCLRTSFFLNGW